MNLLQVLAYLEENFPEQSLTFAPGKLRRVLEREQAVQGTGEAEWIDGKEAHSITGIRERTLRSKAEKWERLQRSGTRPEIRVSATSNSDGAHWRYDRADCLAYAAVRDRPRPTDELSRPRPDNQSQPVESSSDDPIDLAARRYAGKALRT
jgi:hypothetical protein